jgi:hypothetical protein
VQLSFQLSLSCHIPQYRYAVYLLTYLPAVMYLMQLVLSGCSRTATLPLPSSPFGERPGVDYDMLVRRDGKWEGAAVSGTVLVFSFIRSPLLAISFLARIPTANRTPKIRPNLQPTVGFRTHSLRGSNETLNQHSSH